MRGVDLCQTRIAPVLLGIQQQRVFRQPGVSPSRLTRIVMLCRPLVVAGFEKSGRSRLEQRSAGRDAQQARQQTGSINPPDDGCSCHVRPRLRVTLTARPVLRLSRMLSISDPSGSSATCDSVVLLRAGGVEVPRLAVILAVDDSGAGDSVGSDELEREDQRPVLHADAAPRALKRQGTTRVLDLPGDVPRADSPAVVPAGGEHQLRRLFRASWCRRLTRARSPPQPWVQTARMKIRPPACPPGRPGH